MPQHTLPPLIHVLLLWITILTIIQTVFIALFFTHGHTSQNTNAVAAELKKQTQPNNASSFSGHNAALMLSFQAKEGDKAISWTAKNPYPDLVTTHENALILLQDGYYYLNFRVTLVSLSSNETLKFSLKGNEKVLLQSTIAPNTTSTGLLGKVAELSADTYLSISIDPRAKIDFSPLATYLDMIYLHHEP